MWTAVLKRMCMIPIDGLINDPHSNQLPVGLIPKLVEYWTDITEVRVGVPVQFLYFQAFLAKMVQMIWNLPLWLEKLDMICDELWLPEMRCQCLNDCFATLKAAPLEGVKKEMFIYRDYVFVYDRLVCRLKEFSVFLRLRVNPKKKEKAKDSPTNLRRRWNWLCMFRLYNDSKSNQQILRSPCRRLWAKPPSYDNSREKC